jgi:hypothetical protein
MDNTGFKLDDSVLARVVQILQEGIILGEDITDHMRLMRLQVAGEDSNVLILTPQYKDFVADSHNKLLERAKELQGQKDGGKVIFEA